MPAPFFTGHGGGREDAFVLHKHEPRPSTSPGSPPHPCATVTPWAGDKEDRSARHWGAPASPGSPPTRRAPWLAADNELQRDRGKQPINELKDRRRIKPSAPAIQAGGEAAGLIHANMDLLEVQQVERQRTLYEQRRDTRTADKRAQAQRMVTQSSALRAQVGQRRRAAAQAGTDTAQGVTPAPRQLAWPGGERGGGGAPGTDGRAPPRHGREAAANRSAATSGDVAIKYKQLRGGVYN